MSRFGKLVGSLVASLILIGSLAGVANANHWSNRRECHSSNFFDKLYCLATKTKAEKEAQDRGLKAEWDYNNPSFEQVMRDKQTLSHAEYCARYRHSVTYPSHC